MKIINNMFKFEKRGIEFIFERIDYAPANHPDFRMMVDWSNFISYSLTHDSFWGFVTAKDESEAKQRVEKLVNYIAVDIAFMGHCSEFIEDQVERLSEIAKDLKKEQPTEALAVFFGIQDCSYNTQSNGFIKNYKGQAIIQMDNGKKFKAIARPAQGDAYYVHKRSFIEFIEL